MDLGFLNTKVHIATERVEIPSLEMFRNSSGIIFRCETFLAGLLRRALTSTEYANVDIKIMEMS